MKYNGGPVVYSITSVPHYPLLPSQYTIRLLYMSGLERTNCGLVGVKYLPLTHAMTDILLQTLSLVARAV